MKIWLSGIAPSLLKRFLPILGLATLAMFHVERLEAKAVNPEAEATVVVYNDKDPHSVLLATAYAETRGIPVINLIALECSFEETISRPEFEETIANPFRKAMKSRGFWTFQGDTLEVSKSKIQYVALMRGIPLRIAPVEGEWPGDTKERFPGPLQFNNASVDSELAALGRGSKQISGPADNPFFKGRNRFSPALYPKLLLVCRIDAPTPRTARRMIDDPPVVEAQGLWGFAYIDSRRIDTPGLAIGDQWLKKIVVQASEAGMPVIHEDTPLLFPLGYPMTRAALYFGWYSQDCVGPFQNPSFRWMPGAIAAHIHSFSASSLREPLQGWCGPLLEKGATAVLGNVYEPYLHLTPHLDIFHAKLREGWTFAEAAYAAQPALSWMTTFVGDPLYRPFKLQASGRPGKGPEVTQWETFAQGARIWFKKSPEEATKFLQTQGTKLKSGIIFEGLACLQTLKGNSAGALASLKQAQQFYSKEGDKTRVIFHSIGLLCHLDRKGEALAIAKEALKKYGNGEIGPLLKAFVSPPPPPPSAAPASPRP